MKSASKKLWSFLEKNESKAVLALSVLGGGALFIVNYFYFRVKLGSDVIYNLLDILALAIAMIPPAIMEYNKYSIRKNVEEQFPNFLRDITEGLRGGMTLPIAIRYASNNNYGSLNKYINSLVAQISWGVPFDSALHNFVLSIQDPTITRAVSTIIEAHRSGGDIAEALDAVGKSTVEIEKLRRERESRISSQMLNGYIIFFIFIVIMVGMREFLLPALSWGAVSSEGSEIVAASETTVNVELYGRLFIQLAIIQGLFSGLAIGKLSEGTLSAGAKHAIIMSFIGYITLVVAHSFFGTGAGVEVGAAVINSTI